MKILQVIPYFCFGGAETMCENLTYALTNLGHDVTVVSLFPDRTPIALRMEEAGIRILYLDKKPGLDLSMFSKLARIMRREKPDVVHTHLNVIKYAAVSAKLAGIRRSVHTVHNVAQEEAEGTLQKITNKIYFRLGWSIPVALSPEVKNSICSFYGIAADRVPMIYNGVDLSRCMPKEDYSRKGLKLLHIGRFNEQKNHRRLLQAFSLIHRQIPESQLDLIGDGELMEETKAFAKELGLADAVHFLGSQSNVYPYLQQADVFLLPSDYEGMPMTIIEAMGTGLPIVATAVGGVPDMLTNEESGLLVPCDPEAVAEAVLRLAETESLRENLGRKARQESRRFSAEFMAQQYCAAYKKEGGLL